MPPPYLLIHSFSSFVYQLADVDNGKRDDGSGGNGGSDGRGNRIINKSTENNEKRIARSMLYLTSAATWVDRSRQVDVIYYQMRKIRLGGEKSVIMQLTRQYNVSRGLT